MPMSATYIALSWLSSYSIICINFIMPVSCNRCMQPALQQPSHVCTQVKFILLSPQLIATLNNYSCSLPPLANVNYFAFPEFFLPTIQIHNWCNGANSGL